MSTNEIEKLNLGATKIKNENVRDNGGQGVTIQNEVNSQFPHLTPEARESIIKSRLAIINNPRKPSIVQVDLGEDASRKIKEELFEKS